MKQLRVGMLVGLAVVAGVLSWGGAGLWNSLGTLPRVPVAAPVVMAVIAAMLTATALSLRSRLRAQRNREPDARGVDPLMAARAVMFGQASALVGAIVAGLYAGVLVVLLGELEIPPRRDQAIYAGLTVLAAAAVVAAALFLQRVCRLPEDEDNTRGPDDGTGATAD